MYSGAFLQSKGWEAFQRSLGKEVRRENGVLMIRQPLKFGLSYWYVPRSSPQPAEGGGRGAVFIRFDPLTEPIGTVDAPHDVQPRTTILLDLKKSLDQLKGEMHPKTRYNIGVAEKHGVHVEMHGVEALETFWKLMQGTTARDAFRAHPKTYYERMLKAGGDLKIFLAIAYVDDQPAAAAIMIDHDSVRTYLHGASDYALRDKMAPFALHWYLIQDAKAQGMQAYDWWGIAPTDDPKEPLAGVTRFKKGWGGEVLRYPKTQDLILRPVLYRVYCFVQRARYAA